MRRVLSYITPQIMTRRPFLFLTPPSAEGGGRSVIYIYSFAP
jgi:hypothetical protein